MIAITQEDIRQTLEKSIEKLFAEKEKFVKKKGDFSRKGKLTLRILMKAIIAQGAGSTKNEMLDFFPDVNAMPTESALVQKRGKLKPDAFLILLKTFNTEVEKLCPKTKKYRKIAADGSTVSFFSNSKYAGEEYYIKPGHSGKGTYSMHINVLYDLDRQIYLDAVIQPVHQKDEYLAFCHMVDQQTATEGEYLIFIGDRGYCSLNNMAHVIAKHQYFLFRAKDITSKGLAKHIPHPDKDCFDTTYTMKLVRTHNQKVASAPNVHFIDSNTAFDYIEYGSDNSMDLTVRMVRFALPSSDTDSEPNYECILTNLPEDEFSAEQIAELYFERWGIETSFRQLKYTVGLNSFHPRKPESIMQDILARMILFNFTQMCIFATAIVLKKLKHRYKIDFSVAVHICRRFLIGKPGGDDPGIFKLLSQILVYIRPNRKYERLKTAHFRTPKYPNYRPA